MKFGFLLVAMILMLHSTAVAQDVSKKRDRQPVEGPKPDRKVVYKQVGDKELSLFIYDPAAKPEATTRSAIVFYFGGGWKGGTPNQFSWHCRHLADLGMTAIAVDYRVHSRDRANVTDCVADAQDAMLFVRGHANEWRINPQHIAAAGGSAGGHLAAAVATLAYRGTQPNIRAEQYRPNALVLFNPAAVLARLKDRGEPTRLGKELLERLGDKPEALSPYHHLTQELPPTLILHGKSDSTVPYEAVEAFRDRATELGAQVNLIGYADMQHGFFNHGRERYTETRDEMVKFLKKHDFLSQ